MKKDTYHGVIVYTTAGFILGITLIMIGAFLNYESGFNGPWFHIFEYAPDFIIIVFSPLYLSALFCFIGFRREQLVLFNRKIKHSLSKEQIINTAADNQIKLLGKIIAQVNESIVITDASGKIVWVNNGFTNTHGHTQDEAKGKDLTNFLRGPLTDKTVARNIIDRLTQGEDVVEELLTYHKNGTTIWQSLSIKPILDDSGKVSNFIALQNDISSRKEKEIAIAALYKEVANYKFALDQAAIVVIFNTKGKITQVNKKFCDIRKLAEENIIGIDYQTISGSTPGHNIEKPIWDLLLAGHTWTGELAGCTANGQTYWVDTTIVPLPGTDGKPYQFLAMQQDITERKTLQGELLVSKNKLQQAMQIARLGAWEMDINDTLTLSAELKQLYHLPLEGEVTLEQVHANIPAEDISNIQQKMSTGRAASSRVEVEYRYIIQGQVHYMISSNTIKLDAEGNYMGTFGTVQDITDTKLVALALKKSEEEKAVVLNNTQTILCVHDMDGTMLDMNIAAEKASGYTKKEVVGQSLKLIIEAGLYGYFDAYIKAIHQNETVNGRMKIITKSGNKRIWLYQNTVYANNGNKPYVIASAIDITDSVKAQMEIEKQQQFIRQIIDNSPNLLFMLNEQRQIVLANKTFSCYYPYNEMEMPFAKSLALGDDDIFLGNISRLDSIKEGEIILSEGSLKNPSTGQLSWFSIMNKRFKEKSGREYLLCFGMDITSRHKVETDLLAANEMVERSLKVKDEFISNMSHEIRTPLNAVVGFTDLLAETDLSKEQSSYVDIVRTASASLLSLINNILDISKIESNNVILEMMPINVAGIITDAVIILEHRAKTKGLEVRIHFDDALPKKVLGDQLRLSQVIINLFGNAIKFTDKGFIDIECRLATGTDTSKDYIYFSIKDTGIGIAPDKQPTIFQRFTQANTNTERLYGGTGLGLSITKSIIELYGGSISMQSGPGIGTSFYFTLPFEKYRETTNGTEENNIDSSDFLCVNTNNPVHILLAEDNMVNAMLATKVLAKKGFKVKHVINGALAVEAVQQQHFDLILMDIQMPVMNGINASKAIRNLQTTEVKIPIIAMTAYSLYGEMENCYKAGMNGYLAKPFKAVDLFNTIMELVKK